MAKQFFLIIDTESTINDHCADFGAMIVDKQGNIHKEIVILIGDFYQRNNCFLIQKRKGTNLAIGWIETPGR